MIGGVTGDTGDTGDQEIRRQEASTMYRVQGTMRENYYAPDQEQDAAAAAPEDAVRLLGVRSSICRRSTATSTTRAARGARTPTATACTSAGTGARSATAVTRRSVASRGTRRRRRGTRARARAARVARTRGATETVAGRSDVEGERGQPPRTQGLAARAHP